MILARSIDEVCFLGKRELVFRRHREDKGFLNKRNYCEILDLLAKEKQLIREYFSTNSVFKGTSHDIQNDLIQCVTEVLNSHILKVQTTNFISIQADETTVVSCKGALKGIFCCILDDKIEERFIGFFDVSKNKTATGLSEVILNELLKLNISKKLCVKHMMVLLLWLVKKWSTINYTKYLSHGYFHTLLAKTIKDIKLFISNLTMFHAFFSRSSKRNALLREQGFRLPNQ